MTDNEAILLMIATISLSLLIASFIGAVIYLT